MTKWTNRCSIDVGQAQIVQIIYICIYMLFGCIGAPGTCKTRSHGSINVAIMSASERQVVCHRNRSQVATINFPLYICILSVLYTNICMCVTYLYLQVCPTFAQGNSKGGIYEVFTFHFT